MIAKARTPLLFFLALFVGALADTLSGPPQPISATITPNLWAALLFQFVLWIAATRGWGAQIATLLGSDLPEEGKWLGLGAFFYALIAFTLSALGLLRPELRWALILLNALGIALSPSIKIPRLHFILAIAGAPIAVLLALIAIDSLVIHPYWDPLHHHLLGPRIWWEQGKVYFPREQISAYQEGGFEQLFLWPHFFFAGKGGLGLLPVQIFAQLTHFLLGFGGSLILAYSFLRREISTPSGRIFALMLFAIPASLQFGIPTAKNGWGMVLWILTAFSLLGERSLKATFVAAFLFGFTLLAKISSVYAILPILFLSLCFFSTLRRPKPLFLLAAGMLLGMLPLALRNFIGTGDPFFPLFAKWFPHAALGPTWLEAIAAYQTGHVSILTRLFEWSREFLFAPALVALPLLWRKQESALVRILAFSFPLGFLLFYFTAGEPTELRLIGACLPISGLLAGILLDRLLQRLPYRESMPLFLVALSIPFLPFRWDALSRIKKIPHPEEQARAYIGSEAQAWFRSQFVAGQKAALLVDTRLYHSMPYPIVRIWDSPALDAKVREARSAPEFLAILKKEGFSHLILTQEKLDLFYPRALVSEVEGWILANDQHVVFRTPYSLVVELSSY
ncbi:MAG: hypothetical protein AB7K68_04035 [Bacteriovoracia bacterium]